MPRSATRAADPAVLVALLWNPRTAVGRSGLTVESLTTAALAVADAEGLEAVTMRRVADAAGVGAMTLYSYVPGRPELIELMVDRAAASAYDGHRLPAEVGDWRAGAEHVAWRTWEHVLGHPWLAEVPHARPVLGPGITDRYEHELAPLEGIGLADLDMDHLLSSLQGMVLNAARWHLGLERVRTESGLDDAQWWQLVQPVISRNIESGQYPISSRVGESVSSAGEPEEALRRGLRWLLDGVAASLPR